MLTPDQRTVLVAIVAQRIPVNPIPAQLVIFVGERLAAQVPSFGAPREVAEWMVAKALAHTDPRVLIQLIRAVDDLTGRMASLVNLAQLLTDDPATWRSTTPDGETDWSLGGDPLHVLDGRPFVDRGQFRKLVPRKGALESPSCTVVYGDAGHGKSYLREYCLQLNRHWGRGAQEFLPVGYSACPESQLSDLTPLGVAFELAMGLKTSGTAPRPHEDEFRQANNCVAWITQYTPKAPLPALILLDGFDGKAAGGEEAVPAPVLHFIEELISTIQKSGEVKELMRVVLLGYDSSRLEERDLEYETSVLEWVDREEVTDWFQRRFPAAPEYRHTDAALEVLTRLEDILPAADTPEGSANRDRVRMRHLCSLMAMASGAFE